MGRKRSRRQQHGSAWQWKQTDCWYYTLPDTKNRLPLFDEQGPQTTGLWCLLFRGCLLLPHFSEILLDVSLQSEGYFVPGDISVRFHMGRGGVRVGESC